MEACTPVSSISEDFGRHRVNNTYFCCKLMTYVGPKQCNIYGSAEENIKLTTLEGLSECVVDEVHSKVEKLGNAISSLHIRSFLDRKLGIETGECSLNGATGCLKDEAGVQQDASDGIRKKSFDKSATFPCSDTMHPSLPSSEELLENTQPMTECSLESGRSFARSTSLPSSLKLVSALKGGRQKEGAPPRAKLTVKWAPDVYDPPATSLSHTLTNNYPRKPKKKDYHKHKSKGKSSSRLKKHANHHQHNRLS